MVTVRIGVREATESGSKALHRVEVGLIAAYDWLSGPGLTEQDRRQQKIAETESVRHTNRIGF
jgi:hypothetical protein